MNIAVPAVARLGLALSTIGAVDVTSSDVDSIIVRWA